MKTGKPLTGRYDLASEARASRSPSQSVAGETPKESTDSQQAEDSGVHSGESKVKHAP